jgi:spermidine synthase
VVLAGISLGNYIGGWLADRRASLRLLGIVYMLAALTCLGVLWVNRVDRVTPGDFPIVVEIVALTAALFFVPCTILGMISPIIAKLAVSDLAKTGSTVGKIYAAGALGSIVGTFITGFWLIAWLGTHTIVWGVALFLLTLGMIFILGGRWFSFAASALIVIGGTWYAINQSWLTSPCVRETNYYCIKINEEEQEGEQVRLLVLDHLVHSYVSLTDPRRLVYGYEKMYSEVTAYRAQRGNPLRTLMIGGGGYTFPRYVEAQYPGSEIRVVEIDPGVTRVAFDLLALRRDTRILTHNEDARLFFARPPDARYDLVFGDAFNHYSVPYHLTTKEFNDRVRAWLVDDGMYVVNIIDGPYGEFVRAYTHTLQQTFRYVYVAPGIRAWREHSRSTFVLVGTDTPLDLEELRQYGSGYLASQILDADEISKLLTEAPVVLLTDQFAPVDNMLASVFREESPK